MLSCGGIQWCACGCGALRVGERRNISRGFAEGVIAEQKLREGVKKKKVFQKLVYAGFLLKKVRAYAGILRHHSLVVLFYPRGRTKSKLLGMCS